MKKLFGLIAIFIYFFTASSLTHASTMGFFDMGHESDHAVSHCHSDTSTTSDNKSSQNMDCCELFTADHYSQVNLEFKTSLKTFQHTVPEITHKPRLLTLQTFDFGPNPSPGGQTSLGKYHKFSDLSGIIKKTI